MIKINKCEVIEGLRYINGELAHGVYVNSENDMLWYKDGLLHRDDDKPAIIYVGGDKLWFQNGKLHRDGDKPAGIHEDSTIKEWYQNGECHRDGDKPAVIHSDGYKEWYKNGERYHHDTD
jgi:antitoxin component YwqK of YwqJK toxin-antitoxin module